MLARGIVTPCGPDGRQWSLWNIAKHKPFFPTGPCDSEDFMKGGWCVWVSVWSRVEWYRIMLPIRYIFFQFKKISEFGCARGPYAAKFSLKKITGTLKYFFLLQKPSQYIKEQPTKINSRFKFVLYFFIFSKNVQNVFWSVQGNNLFKVSLYNLLLN